MTSTDIRPVESRVTRRCDGCGQIDDHPHHLTTIVDELGERTVSKHMDCCGCPVCAASFQAAEASEVGGPGTALKGLDLADFIIAGGTTAATAPLTEA